MLGDKKRSIFGFNHDAACLLIAEGHNEQLLRILDAAAARNVRRNARGTGDTCADTGNIPLPPLVLLYKGAQIKAPVVHRGKSNALLCDVRFS
ncbi:hypothetical protein D3C84_1089470 [compost metagenome]